MFTLGKNLLEKIKKAISKEPLKVGANAAVADCFACSGTCTGDCQYSCETECVSHCGTSCTGHYKN